MPFVFREGHLKEISYLQIVRHSIKENMISNPIVIIEKDFDEYLTKRGKGWSVRNIIITGFAIAGLQENSIWALFCKA